MKNIHRVTCVRCGKKCDVPRTFTTEFDYNRQICHSCYEIYNKNQATADEYSRQGVDIRALIDALNAEVEQFRSDLQELQQDYATVQADYATVQADYTSAMLQVGTLQDELTALQTEFDEYKAAHPE